MSKEVKIGLSIGGILLAVLIVYLLVPKNNPNAQYAREGQTSQTADGREGATSGLGYDGTSSSSPGGASQESPTAQQQTSPQTGQETTRSNDQTATGGASPSDATAATTPRSVDWERILTTGIVPEEAKVPLAAQGGTGAPRDDVFSEPQKAPGTTGGNDINWNSAPATPPAAPVTPGQHQQNAPAVVRTGPKDHVIQQGESLSSISLFAYGDARYYREILKANPTLDERKLRPGTKILIPDPSTFSAGRARQAVARLEPTIDSAKEYRVVAGDSLHKIAIKLYGKPAKADDLYELNKDKIGDDSSRVKVGMVLKLPEAPTATSARTSR